MVLCLFIAISLALGKPRIGREVPFEFWGNEVLVTVRIDGNGPFTMMLDTGTSPSVIDLKVAKSLGLKMGEKGEAGSGGGNNGNLQFETRLPTVDVGGFSAHQVDALASDLSGLTSKFGRQIDGVLGDSLLDGHIVQFDYPGRVARFLPSFVAHPASAHEITVPFSHEGEEVHFRGMRINGRAVLANLDTGSNGTFSLTPRGIRHLGLGRSLLAAKSSSAVGFNGKYSSKLGNLRRVRLGPFKVGSAPVVFWLPGSGHDDRSWDVNVGNRFFKDYVVTIDYLRHRVNFKKI